MNGSALQLTLREMQRHFRDPRTLGILAVAAVVLGLAGPFGSFETMAVLPRLAYWAATVVVTYAAGFFVSALADRLVTGKRPFWLRLPAMVVPTSIVVTLVVTLFNAIAFGAEQVGVGAFLLLSGQCLAVSSAVVAVMLLLETKDGSVAQAAAEAPAPVLERVPLAQRGRLLALVVEDHYVDIVTDRGKTLVLMRLADAVRETGGVAGLQIHRSHWVARDAVVKAHRAEGKLLLELSNGMRLPVSRGYMAGVRDAGLA